jgi:Cys-rich protein (TIGR01571 family)
MSRLDTVFASTCQPEGGVSEGQIFLTPLPASFHSPRIQAPTGQWKDGLCDCYQAVPSDIEGSTPMSYLRHPSTWCALFCTQLALGQVMSRMQLTWLGEPGTPLAIRSTWTVVVTLFVAFLTFEFSLGIAEATYNDDYGTGTDTPGFIQTLKFAGNFLFTLWAIYALCRTRENVRARYQIPEQYSHLRGCEDLCCAIWCSACTTAQMLRHTGEYEHYPGVCCSSTGHPTGTPLVV